MKNGPLNRPFGTQGCPTTVPALKRWAILVSSLRDDGAQILEWHWAFRPASAYRRTGILPGGKQATIHQGLLRTNKASTRAAGRLPSRSGGTPDATSVQTD
jgi:hypothetical protein